MKGYFRIRLVFGTWTIIYYSEDMKNIGEAPFPNYDEALEFSKTITDYKDADKSDLPVGDGKQKSGNLA